jgi:endo-1,4-beta-D-glucanase Y
MGTDSNRDAFDRWWDWAQKPLEMRLLTMQS